MNAKQYRQTLQNRACWSPKLLFDDRAARDVLRKLAADVRRRQRAQQAWERAAPPDLLALSEVVAHDGPVLHIVARTDAAAAALRRAAPGLSVALRRLHAGVARIVVRTSDELASDDAEEKSL